MGFSLYFSKKVNPLTAMVCSLFLLAGCGASALKVTRMKPAEINLSSYKKIALADIKGSHADAFANKLNQALFDSKRFEVLDRSNIQQIMKEQNMAISDAFNPGNSVKIGQLLGSAALIFGDITRRDYKENRKSEKRKCYRDKQEYSCTYYTVEGKWDMEVGLKMVDTSTGKILATKNLTATTEKDAGSYEGRPEKKWDEENVFGGLNNYIVQNFMKMIAPYSVLVELKLFTNSKLPELEKGVQFATYGEWDSAIEQFKTACSNADNNPEIKPNLRARAYYNLGVAYGYSGQYDEGLKELKNATSIQPEEVFYSEIKKIKQKN